jgi:glycosyltransferase involved in cell wall biosynthesis
MGGNMSENFISVVCASKNEENDITNLITSFNLQDYPNKELIIIDDSSDETRSIVNSYIKESIDSNIILIEGSGEGCCPARNVGVRTAKGNIICYMTADSFFSDSNYLNHINKKFHNDKHLDVYMPNSFVSNQQDLYADFIHCWQQHKFKIKGDSYSPLTAQGYCVKKESAMRVGLIDSIEVGKLPFNVCRDWTLVKKMDKLGFNKEFDKSCLVPHTAPHSLKDFFWTHSQRGVISAGYNIFFRNKTRPRFLLESFVKLLKSVLYFLSLVGPLKRSIVLMQYSSNRKSILDFIKCDLLKSFSFHYGEISSIFIKKR